LIGRDGALKLLLNQDSPLASERLLTYYGYFSRAGADRIGRIEAMCSSWMRSMPDWLRSRGAHEPQAGSAGSTAAAVAGA